MNSNRKLVAMMLCLALIAIVVACAPAPTTAPTAAAPKPTEAPKPTAPPAAAKQTLVVYTAKEPDEIKDYLEIAKKELPDLELEVLRLSTGDLTARLLAEKNNPRADVIWGTAATSMIIFENQGMLEPYAPKGVESILPTFKSPKSPPTWVGVDAYETAFCFNTDVAKKQNLPKPTSWADLTKPVYKGQIVMPNPASSGTGYMFVSSVLQGLGKDKGWAFLDELDKNMAQYTKSGSKPCKLAGTGEFAVGISFGFVGLGLKKGGAPLELIWPTEGAGFEVEANALVKGTKKVDAAKKFLDWAIGDSAMKAYAKYFAIMAKGGFPPPEGYPTDIAAKLFKMDHQWSSDNRDAVLKEWTTRYSAKAEK